MLWLANPESLVRSWSRKGKELQEMDFTEMLSLEWSSERKWGSDESTRKKGNGWQVVKPHMPTFLVAE
jgi:hypothetical protein